MPPIFDVPAGRIRFCVADRVDHVGRRQPLGLQRVRIEVDHDLRLLAAVGLRNRRALDRGQLRAEEVHAEVVELLLGQALARQPELEDRDVEALYVMMNGGVVPGGSWRSTDCEIAAICATAASVLAPGWKKTLTTACRAASTRCARCR